jgi:hypothetical protein
MSATTGLMHRSKEHPLHRETNYRTEFVIALNNQPQGGIINRPRSPDVRVARRDDFGFGWGWLIRPGAAASTTIRGRTIGTIISGHSAGFEDAARREQGRMARRECAMAAGPVPC